MGRRSRVAPLLAAAALAAFTATCAVAAPDSSGTKPFAEAVQGLTKLDGLVPVYVDKAQGKIFLSLPAPDASGVAGRYLYMTALETGLGSAPVGLDRDAPSEAQILVFRRVGKKVLAEIENPKFRATGAPAAEQEAARNSFAFSTLWAGEVAAESPDGRILVDVSNFLTRDSMGVADALARAGEGSWRLSQDLTVADPGAVKAFPENFELAARETFVGEKPGPEVYNIAPDPKQITLIVHYSLVKLPEPGFKPRRSIRARALSTPRSSTTPPRSAIASSTASPTASAWRRSIPPRRARG